jgi:asparagine N-glycosylation enzyme membrane subunit Stt3
MARLSAVFLCVLATYSVVMVRIPAKLTPVFASLVGAWLAFALYYYYYFHVWTVVLVIAICGAVWWITKHFWHNI